ncbi:hydrolase [Rhodococcus hoagii]|uniref:Hydrolase, carbon-nitrogen family n=1 Tax=Prescottella equi ATCC 33707 TaxID=525370 RepID=E9SWW0_RHOHA|nr:hydrolase, carbon-nitrogen family [Prescottella equi ATCC 33707]NKS33625.1 hydrolase [Prescottella equi]
MTGRAHVAVAQLAPRLLDFEANADMTVDAIASARERGADIVVLPELCLSGYMFDTMDEARSCAITPEHPVFARWARALAGSQGLVVGGFAERSGSRLHISAAVVGATGVQAVYRKTHLWNREKRFFTAGTEAPPVVDTAFGRVGVLICYDLEFPEMARSLAMRGADLIAVPTNWALDARPYGDEPPQVMLARAAARTNHVHVACADRAGRERDQDFTGGSAVIDTAGWVLDTPDATGFAAAVLTLTTARDRQISGVNHVFGDRRPELYDGVYRTAETA